MRFIVLTTLLTILIPTISATETTNNLVSQDFTSGWTNTTNTYHGSGTIAGHHGGTVTSDSVSLADDVGLNKNEINQGFTVNSSASVWFWNNYDQSVTMTTQAIDDNGQTITQTRTLSGTCATWNGCDFGSMTDTMVFNSNTQADYDLSLGFSFSVTDTNYQSGHYAADLKDPSMTVTYTPINLDSTTETALLDLNKDIKDDLKNVDTFKFEEEDTFKFEEEPVSLNTQEESFQETKAESTFEDTFKDQDSSSISSSEEQLDSEENLTEPKSEEKEEEPKSTETKEDNEKTEDSSENQQEAQSSTSESKQDVALNKTMQKIDEKVKDIGTNLGLKNLVKLKAMSNNAILLDYANKAFYQEKRIYENQADIRDNRVLYADVSLVSYTQNDPIFTKEKELFNIRLQKQKLLEEIKVLKNEF